MGLDIFFYKHTTSNDIIKNDIDALAEARRDSRKAELPMEQVKELVAKKDKETLIAILESYKVYGFEFVRLEDCAEDEIEYWVNSIIESYTNREDMYYRKVNLLYAYFADRLDNESCIVTRHDCEDIIKKCEIVLEKEDESISESLLPTQGGFFFGSTQYDDNYYYDVRDVLNQFKEYLNNWTDETIGWVYFSW